MECLLIYWSYFSFFYHTFPAIAVKSESVSYSVMSNSLRHHGLQPPQTPLSMEFSRQEYWGGQLSLIQIFPTQGSNSGLLHLKQILRHLSHQGSPLLWLTLCVCSFTSVDSTIKRLKLLGWGVIPESFTKTKLEFSGHQQLCTQHLHYPYNYLHGFYIVQDIISHLEMIQSMWEDMCSLYANSTPFYIRKLSICRF